MEKLTGDITGDTVYGEVKHSQMVTLLWNEFGLTTNEANAALRVITDTGYWRNELGSVTDYGLKITGYIRYTVRIYQPTPGNDSTCPVCGSTFTVTTAE